MVEACCVLQIGGVEGIRVCWSQSTGTVSNTLRQLPVSRAAKLSVRVPGGLQSAGLSPPHPKRQHHEAAG